MKKLLFLPLIFLFLLGCTTEEKNTCNILPKDSNYKIVLNSKLYIFTEHGLVERGFFVDFERWDGDMIWPTLDVAKKSIYFTTSHDFNNGIVDGVYKIGLTKSFFLPIFIASSEDGRGVRRLSISLDGVFLTFCLLRQDKRDCSDVILLNLKTKRQQRIADDAFSLLRPIWINDHQFIYCNYVGVLFLFDVNTMEKTDLKLNDYRPGAITPNGKHILLSGNNKTVLYNLSTKTIDETIMDKEIEVGSMIWLPDGRGFIYHNMSFEETYSLIAGDSVGGISYYSLDKKKSVRLIGKGRLEGGFIVPPDIELNPVDNEHNRRMLSFAASDSTGVRKICVSK